MPDRTGRPWTANDAAAPSDDGSRDAQRRVRQLIRRLSTPEGRADPHAIYDELRAMGPAVRTPWGAWLVTSDGASHEVLRGPGWRTVDAAWRTERQPAWVRHPGLTFLHDSALGTNPPGHAALRRSLGAFVSPQTLAGLTPQIVRTVHEYVDRFEAALRADGEADFGALVGDRLPMAVLCIVLGLPHEDIPLLCDMSRALSNVHDLAPGRERLAQADRAGRLWNAYWEQLVTEPRSRLPEDSPLVRWLDTETDPAVRAVAGSQLNVMIEAGLETTTSLLSEGLVQLLRRPDQVAWLLEHPESVNGAVEELVRLVTPAQLLSRYATEDTELPGGVPVAAGQVVHVVIAAANHDPAVYHAPHDLDLSRPPRRNLAFGVGMHYCLGAPLARLEATTLFPELLRRLDLELAGPVGYDESIAFRGTRSVPVRRRSRTTTVRTGATAAASGTATSGITAQTVAAAVPVASRADAAGPVVVERDDAVLLVTLTRPDGDNRLDRATLTALAGVLESLPDDVDAVVLRAEGRHFCVGADLDELGRLATDDPDGYRDLVALGDQVLHAWRTCPPVTVAALHGFVVGAGLGLATASDLRVAATGTRFRAPETILGIPVGASEMLDRVIAETGPSRTRMMLLLGDAVSGEQALESGLVHHVVPAEDVWREARRLARRVARRDRQAVRVTKQTMARLPQDGPDPAHATGADAWEAPQARALRRRVAADDAR
ncbi:cytochrome P450 [Myceligenerans salitolerans]|uniref:Cytochrome P450 n=1 Tax=Myceligenerans salitolerans TaxID=1230528 RepID=A0ABS3I8J7_9MICO|nr:cytochrome P450 [Myceligenerans salitolerans]MBO0609264.1 cytochrome P450 [Myceligenerans salitolerans]